MNKAVEKHELKKAVANELNRLAKSGRLTPDMVIESARDPDSPLHDYFEWDDAKCGCKYRQSQARTLIASVTITHTVEKRKIQVNVWVRDPEADACKQGYVATSELRTNREVATEAVLAEFNRAESYMERVRALAKYLKVDIQALENAWARAKEQLRHAAETEEVVEAE